MRASICYNPAALFAATDGNHGRAVARMGSIFGAPVRIFVPAGMHPTTIEMIASEEATVTQTKGSYDGAVLTAFKTSQMDDGNLIQDTVFEHYEETPQRTVDGYTTILSRPTAPPTSPPSNQTPAPASTPPSPPAPPTPITPAVPTTMAGMDCGNVSTATWPVLRPGVSAACTVSDHESGPAGRARGAVRRRCGCARWSWTSTPTPSPCCCAPRARGTTPARAAKCSIALEGRTGSGETAEAVEKVESGVASFECALRIAFERSRFEIPKWLPFVELVGRQVRNPRWRRAHSGQTRPGWLIWVFRLLLVV